MLNASPGQEIIVGEEVGDRLGVYVGIDVAGWLVEGADEAGEDVGSDIVGTPVGPKVSPFSVGYIVVGDTVGILVEGDVVGELVGAEAVGTADAQSATFKILL